MPRFYCGPLYNGPWAYPEYYPDLENPDHSWVFQNYQVDLSLDPTVGYGWYDAWPDDDDGLPTAVDFTDLENSYIEAVADPFPMGDGGVPTWYTGSHIYDNMAVTWTVVLPDDINERRLYLYPNPSSGKIYYGKEDVLYQNPGFEWYPELSGAGSVPFTVDPADPTVIWNSWWSTGENDSGAGYSSYSIITEVGEDAHGVWFKMRPVLASDPHSDGHNWPQVFVCGAQWFNLGYLSGGGANAYVIVVPHPPDAPEPPPAPPSFDETRDEFVGQARLSIYLSEEIDAFDVFSIINAAVASYLFNDHLGKYRYVAYTPPAGASLLQFTEDEIFSFSEEVDASAIISRVKAKFQHRVTQDYWQIKFVERPEAQYLQRSPVPIFKEVEFPFVMLADALKGGQRTALIEGVPQRMYKCRVSSKGWTLLPADFIQITYMRHGINGIFEVIETKRDLKTGKVDLTVGGLRGITGGGLTGGFGFPGHWTDETDGPLVKFPSSLGGADASVWDKDWTADQKAYAKQNFGYWCDENGFADPTDPESYLCSTWA